MIGIGSGGNYALAAARALLEFDLSAEETALRAMKIAAEGRDRLGILIMLTLLTAQAAAEGQFKRSLRLEAALDALHERTRVPPHAVFHMYVDRELPAARAALSPAEARLAAEEGRALTLEQVIAEALAGP